MNRAASLLVMFLCSGAAACASSLHSGAGNGGPPPFNGPSGESTPWMPIALTTVSEPGLRQALTDLLMFVDVDVLWPGFALAENPVIVVDSRGRQPAMAYCVGHCFPPAKGEREPSRLWLATFADTISPGDASSSSQTRWKLPGKSEIVAVGFQRREQTVTVVLHEHFHVHYQIDYLHTFGDEIRGDSGPASGLTRADLETSYGGSEPVTGELRGECAALGDALRAGNGDRQAALAALRRFAAIRDARRARPGAPSFEEDFWEREEGVPVNLERRAARRMGFMDPSLIGTALMGNGCAVIPRAAYFLMLGGLQGAVLDELGDANAWPHRVYPRDGTPAVSLYLLVRELLTESERGDS